MNEKNPLSENSWLQNEIQALRADEPAEPAVDRAVFAMQATPAAPAKNRMIWRAATSIGAVAVLGGLVAIYAPSVNATEFDRYDAALKKQTIRHTLDYRYNDKGELVLANEYWVEGDKHRAIFRDADGKRTYTGYNGAQSYVVRDGQGGFVDDRPTSSFPVETINDYLAITNASIQSIERGLKEGAATVDLFSIRYGGMVMDLYIEPKSGLPLRRVVKTKAGPLEENHYDYPADIPDAEFDPPTELVAKVDNYTIQRAELQRQIEGPGQTKLLNGRKITLYATIVNRNQFVVLYSGGAKTDSDQNGRLGIIGIEDGNAIKGGPSGFWTGSVYQPADAEHPPIMRKGQALIADAMWYREPLQLKVPFTVSIPIWEEDRSRTVRLPGQKEPSGFHSKLVGRVEFEVTNPIFTNNPERIIFPAGPDWIKVGNAASSGG